MEQCFSQLARTRSSQISVTDNPPTRVGQPATSIRYVTWHFSCSLSGGTHRSRGENRPEGRSQEVMVAVI